MMYQTELLLRFGRNKTRPYLFTLHYYFLLAKNPAKLVKSEELRVKKVKIPHFRAGFLAGAGGFEPATHGFGDRYSTS